MSKSHDAGEDDEESLTKKIAAWLQQEGYPLEFRTAEVFRQARFEVMQGIHVRDPESPTPREIDVVARRFSETEIGRVFVEVVIECKQSRKKPWVVFSHRRGMDPSACIAQAIANEPGHAILWAKAGDARLMNLPTFASSERTGFGGRQAFSDGKDIFYNALQSVVSVSTMEAATYGRADLTPLDSLRHPAVILPVIVVDGLLFEAFQSESGQTLRIESRDRVRLHWRGAERWFKHSTVDIVRADTLSNFAAERLKDVKCVLDCLAEGVAEFNNAFKKNDASAVPITVGPRGSLGVPRLLGELQRRASAKPGG